MLRRTLFFVILVAFLLVIGLLFIKKVVKQAVTRWLARAGGVSDDEVVRYEQAVANGLFEDTSFCKETKTYVQVKDGVSYYHIGTLTTPVLVDVAEYFSFRSWDHRAFAAKCSLLGYSDRQAIECALGTELLSQKIKEYREHLRARAAVQVLLAPREKNDAPLSLPKLSVPSRTHRDHACNELVGAPVYEPLPELPEAWHKLWDALREGAPHRWESQKTHLPPALPVANHPVHFIHPRYGKYGYPSFCIKEDFSAELVMNEKTEIKKPTSSVALDTPLPYLMPQWDRHDNETLAWGALGRIGREPVPKYDMDLPRMEPYIVRAVDIIINILEEHGLQPQVITPLDSWKWLAQSHFPAHKKQAYAEAFARVCVDDEHFISAEQFSNKHTPFGKNENYVDCDKVQRLILAGDLEMAAVLAPACDILGNYFFSTQYTSKKIPVRDRPKAALQRFGHGPVILNDMSAFEGSITARLKDLIEHRILAHFFPNILPWLTRCNEDLDMWLQRVHIRAASIRCSGDPQTSLGNSLTNLASIFAAYIYTISQYSYEEWDFPTECKQLSVWVEGDDSLVAVPWMRKHDNRYNHPYDHYITKRRKHFLATYKSAFRMMGFATKMEEVNFVGDAGYCSMFFDSGGNNCPCVAQTFMTFPWNNTGNLGRGRELLGLKASSLVHEARGQPLTWAISEHYKVDTPCYVRQPYNAYEYEELRREGYNVFVDDSHMVVELAPFDVPRPTRSQRQLFAERYGIDIETQKAIEARIIKRGVSGLRHKHMVTICQAEGLNLAAYETFFHDNVNIEHCTDYIRQHFVLKRGEDGKFSKVQKSISPQAIAPSIHHGYEWDSRVETGPYTAHAREEKLRIARRIRHLVHSPDYRMAFLHVVNQKARVFYKYMTIAAGVILMLLTCVSLYEAVRTPRTTHYVQNRQPSPLTLTADDRYEHDKPPLIIDPRMTTPADVASEAQDHTPPNVRNTLIYQRTDPPYVIERFNFFVPMEDATLPSPIGIDQSVALWRDEYVFTIHIYELILGLLLWLTVFVIVGHLWWPLRYMLRLYAVAEIACVFYVAVSVLHLTSY